MCDSLLGSRHHSVVGSDDDDGDIRHLSTTGTHSGERLVTRSVEERNLTSVLQLHVVCTDVLCDAASLAGDDVCLAYIVEQRGLTVVYVAHHGYDRSARNEVVLVVLHLGDSLLHLCTYVFCLEVELLSHEVDGLGVETLVDRHHDAHAHERTNHLVHAHVHHRSELRYGNELGQLQCLALLVLLAQLLVYLLLSSLALLLTILRALLVLVLLVCEACKCLLYLACYVLVVHLSGLLLSAAVAVLLLVLVACAGIAATVLLATIASVGLVRRSVDVHAHLVDAFAFLLVAALLLSLVLTLLALLLLRLLLRTGALVESREVYLAQHVHLWCVEHLLLALGCEDVCFCLCCLSLIVCSLHLLRGACSVACSSLYLLLLFLFVLFVLTHSVLIFVVIVHVSLCACFLWCFVCCRLLTYGISLRLRLFMSLRCCWLCLRWLLVQTVKVYFAQRLVLLLSRRLEEWLSLWLLAAFLLFRLLLQELLGLRTNLLVLLEGSSECVVLCVAQLEAWLCLYFSKVTSLLKELHCRLEPDVQLS